MKRLRPLFITLLLPGVAAAQIADIGWTTSPLPYGRVLKHTSLHLDALQLSLPVEDETNYIGLDSWGDNPAGLTTNVRPALKFLWGSSAYGPHPDLSRELSGLYFSHSSESVAIEVEGLRDAFLYSQPDESEDLSGSAAFGVKTDNLLFGALWTGTSYENNYWSYNSKETSGRTLLGVGTILNFSNSSLTLGLDGGMNKSRRLYDDDSHFNLSGPEYGLQAILKFEGGALGLKAHGGEMGNETVYSYGRYKYDYSYRTGAVRFFKRFDSVPFNLGAEWESTRQINKTRYDSVYWPSSEDKTDFTYSVKAAGLAWRLEPGLLCFEARERLDDLDYYGTWTDSGRYRTFTTAFEYPVLRHVGIILSYLRGTSSWTYTNSSNPSYNYSDSASLYSLGGGLTIKPSEALDLAASYKYIYTEGTIVNSLKLQTNFYF